MQPKISYTMVERVSRLAQKPISRGFEKALVIILDDYENFLKNNKKNDLSLNTRQIHTKKTPSKGLYNV